MEGWNYFLQMMAWGKERVKGVQGDSGEVEDGIPLPVHCPLIRPCLASIADTLPEEFANKE